MVEPDSCKYQHDFRHFQAVVLEDGTVVPVPDTQDPIVCLRCDLVSVRSNGSGT